MDILTLNPYQILRSWDRKKGEFPEIKGDEKLFTYSLLCIEEQVSYITKKYDSMYDEDVTLAYSICGLRVIEILNPEQKYEFVKVAPEVLELSDRCMATFSPEDYKKIALFDNDNDWEDIGDDIWETPEDRVKHFQNIGSALHRLTYSCKFWSKRQGLKGYVKYLDSFLKEASVPDSNGKIHYTFMAQS